MYAHSNDYLKQQTYIPHLNTIEDFYRLMRIGLPQGNAFSVMRIEDQPISKRLEMPLFRGSFYRIVFLNHSAVTWNLPDKQLQTSKYSIYFAYPSKLESWLATPQNKGYLICFTPHFARKYSSKFAVDQQYPFFSFGNDQLLHLSEAEAQSISETFEAILTEIQHRRDNQEEMLFHLLFQCLIQIKRVYQRRQSQLSQPLKHEYTIFRQFKQVLDTYFEELTSEQIHQQASVSVIAERVNLHPSYLNSVVKSLTDHTASSYIREKTILEAKSYLMHTDLQVAEVSHRLGFTNVSYFNRFFKKATGSTPTSFKLSVE